MRMHPGQMDRARGCVLISSCGIASQTVGQSRSASLFLACHIVRQCPVHLNALDARSHGQLRKYTSNQIDSRVVPWLVDMHLRFCYGVSEGRVLLSRVACSGDVFTRLLEGYEWFVGQWGLGALCCRRCRTALSHVYSSTTSDLCSQSCLLGGSLLAAVRMRMQYMW